MGERVLGKILKMERESAGDYVLLSNIFVGVVRYADSERVRRVMDERNASKVPGHSLILLAQSKFYHICESSLYFILLELKNHWSFLSFYTLLSIKKIRFTWEKRKDSVQRQTRSPTNEIDPNKTSDKKPNTLES